MSTIADTFSDLLPTHAILRDISDLRTYGCDTSKNFTGQASIVLLPDSTEQVQAIVQRCMTYQLPLIPSGGRTGLCGGATAMHGEVVLSLQRMNKILSIDAAGRSVTVEAGVTNLKLQEAVAPAELFFPIHLGSWGSCHIGGNIATNAGGIHVIRYGHTRNWILSLTVVTGNGVILRTGKNLYKDNSGYDLRSLFIGSEGTLGIITEATVALAPKPKGLTRIVCPVRDIAQTIPLLHAMLQSNLTVSAFEFFSDKALGYVTRFRKIRDPFPERYPYYVLIEVEGEPEITHEQAQVLFMNLLEEESIEDVVIAQTSQQSEELMSLRESISETLSSHFTPHKNDISVPVSVIPAFTEELQAFLNSEAPEYELVLFGHIGDGNIHLNWLKPDGVSDEDFFKRSAELDAEILKRVVSKGGSISAEHGIGLLKKKGLHLGRNPEEISYMKSIKNIFDPGGIMNPGKIFDITE
jgi:glycolate oxidase subunit GlcD